MLCLGVSWRCLLRRKEEKKQTKETLFQVSSCTCYFICGFSNFKTKREQEHKTQKGNSFVGVNLYPDTVIMYHRLEMACMKDNLKELKSSIIRVWKDENCFDKIYWDFYLIKMVKTIYLLSSWRECCNHVHEKCMNVIKDKCQIMNWAHTVSLYIYKKNIYCMTCLYGS